MKQNPQVSATITPELYSDIKDFAEKENRSISLMVAMLLQLAIKEKTRKRNGKKDNT
jgi:hypothetical protein